ncbi:MAG: hypothetical protein QW568_01335 [Candidatus Anstonellaceae archaeon]
MVKQKFCVHAESNIFNSTKSRLISERVHLSEKPLVPAYSFLHGAKDLKIPPHQLCKQDVGHAFEIRNGLFIISDSTYFEFAVDLRELVPVINSVSLDTFSITNPKVFSASHKHPQVFIKFAKTVLDKEVTFVGAAFVFDTFVVAAATDGEIARVYYGASLDGSKILWSPGQFHAGMDFDHIGDENKPPSLNFVTPTTIISITPDTVATTRISDSDVPVLIKPFFEVSANDSLQLVDEFTGTRIYFRKGLPEQIQYE